MAIASSNCIPNSHPICERCWRRRHANWAHGPIRTPEREFEKCCDCGDETKDGIYITAERGMVRYPRFHPKFDDWPYPYTTKEE